MHTSKRLWKYEVPRTNWKKVHLCKIKCRKRRRKKKGGRILNLMSVFYMGPKRIHLAPFQ